MFESFTPAQDAVLQTAELVIMTLEYLDKLSLVRSQGVNRLFRDLVSGTKALRRRIGFLQNNAEEVIDVRNAQACPDLRWNPLLDWFTTRALLMDGNLQGPIDQSADFVVFHLLPHAIKAAANQASSLHNISITSRPVNRVIMKVHVHGDELYVSGGASNEHGVRLGDLLGQFSKLKRRVSTPLLSVHIPYETDRRQSAFYPNHRPRRTRRSFEDTMFVHHKSNRPQPPKIFTQYDQAMTDMNYGHMLLSKFRDGCDEVKSRQEQNELMASLLLHMREWAAMKHLYLSSGKAHPEWPALAWKGGEYEHFDKLAPYKVDYAAGLVFNRQDCSNAKQ